MPLTKDHDLHKRRLSMNVGVGLVLLALVALVFGITVVKIANGSLLEAADHQPRASALPIAEGSQ
jgi:hypothetical protein